MLQKLCKHDIMFLILQMEEFIMLKVFAIICQLCGIFMLLCLLFRGTRFYEVVHSWMEKHKNVTAVFAVLAIIGLAISIVGTRF